MKSNQSGRENVGSAESPIDFGKGLLAYKCGGRWRRYVNSSKRRSSRNFIEVTDHELILELETRGYQILNPAHECIDRPHLPCPACEKGVRRTRGIAS